MPLESGRLRHRVDIDDKLEVQDPVTGEITESWVAFASNVPAAIEPLSVRDFIASQSVQSEITLRVVIRNRPGLRSTMRIRHGDRIYNPAGWLPDPDSGLEYVTAPCSEGVNLGG